MTGFAPLAVRVEAGEELRSAIERLVAADAEAFCDVTGFGELEWVELAGVAERDAVSLKGPFQLLDLKGRLRRAGPVSLLDLVCTLARPTGGGIQLLGGKLLRAGIAFVELTLYPLPPPVVTSDDAPRPPEPTGESAQAPSPPPDRWARAIAESERIQQAFEDEEASDALPQRGDVVNHRQFGACTVVRVGDAHITLRKPDRRNVQLGLSILRFTPVDRQGGHSVFDVEIRRTSDR